jgi:hypothetical protein
MPALERLADVAARGVFKHNRGAHCDLKGFPAEVNRGFPRADRGRILCALIRREVGHARNVSQ